MIISDKIIWGIVLFVLAVAGVIVSQVAITWRSNPKRLALRQAKRDVPNERVVSCEIERDSALEVALVRFSSGQVLRYRIARKEEMAIRLK